MLDKLLKVTPYNSVSKYIKSKTLTGKCHKCKMVTHSTDKDGKFLCCLCHTPHEKFSETKEEVRIKPAPKMDSVLKRKKRKTVAEKRKAVFEWDKARRFQGCDTTGTSTQVRMRAWAKELKIHLREFKPSVFSNRYAKGKI